MQRYHIVKGHIIILRHVTVIGPVIEKVKTVILNEDEDGECIDKSSTWGFVVYLTGTSLYSDLFWDEEDSARAARNLLYGAMEF